MLTYPRNGYPTDIPRPQLFTRTLQPFAKGGDLVNGGTVNANQEWGAARGPLS